MQPDEVKRQAKLMHEQGFGGYFMHSRVGLETPYMGEEWMTAIGAGIDAALELNMEAWFYDEDKWPSGFAGGMVPALGDDYRVKGLETQMLDADGLAKAWAEPGPGIQPGALRAIYQLQLENGKVTGFQRLQSPPTGSTSGTYMLCQMRTAPSGQAR
jgi:hypothetical protein